MISTEKNARVGKSAERRHPRFKVEGQIEVFCSVAKMLGKVLDVSESGIAVHLANPLRVGDRVILHFTLPHSEHRFRVQATVKCANGSRHGMEFYKLARLESDELWRACRLLTVRV